MGWELHFDRDGTAPERPLRAAGRRREEAADVIR